MSKIDDGGPAFPMSGDPGVEFDRGMSIRDYFAANAMQAMISCFRETLLGDRHGADEGNSRDISSFCRELGLDSDHSKDDQYDGCDEIAQDAYRFADAMLKARKA